MIIITLDGLIGAGKTYELNRLEKILDNKLFKIIHEPFDKIPIFSKYLKNRKKYATQFQTSLVKMKLKLIHKYIDEGYKYIIMERSFESDEIFAKNNIKDESDLNNYIIGMNIIKKDMSQYTNIKLYLDTDVETCLKRIKLRGREDNITKEYLELLKKGFSNIKLHNITPDEILEYIINNCH